MNPLTRRSFFSGAAGIGACGLLGSSTSGNGQLVWTASDWKTTGFHTVLEHPGRVKQVYDVTRIGEGKFLNNIKNSLNGLRFGFGIPEDQIKVVAALHGPANMLNFDNTAWKKYRLGEWLQVTDPGTGSPAERNIFYAASKREEKDEAAKDPQNEHSVYQERTIQALQGRGIQFLSCHTATEEQARVLVRELKLSSSPEEVVRDLLAHTLPGVLVVPSMVAAIALLQAEGHYTYITV